MRRLAGMTLTLIALAVPATAHGAVDKRTFTEDSTGVTPMDAENGLAACVGYTGTVYEDRRGVWKVTVGKRDAHVEGEVHARFRIAPPPGQPGPVYEGTYVEQDVGRLLPSEDEDLPHPKLQFQLRAHAVGSDGSTLRFHNLGQVRVDLRTGEIVRDRSTLTCSVT